MNGKLLKLQIVLISLVFTLAFAEAFLGWTGISALHDNASSYRQSDAWLHHSLVPNSEARFRSNEWNVQYSINSFGMRDREYSIEKPEGVLRVAVLGDSTAEGYGVEVSDSYPKKLESKLGGQVEVLNFAVASYSPLIHTRLLPSVLEFNPDLVILHFDWTDVHDDYKYAHEVVSEVQVKPRFSPTLWLAKHSFTYQFFAQRLAKLTTTLVPGDLNTDRLMFTRDNLSMKDYERLFSYSEPFLLQIKELLEAEGVPFFILVSPFGHQVSESAWVKGRSTYFLEDERVYPASPFVFVQNWGFGNNVIVVNTLPAFKTHPNPATLFFEYDLHPTEAGHEVIAQTLYEVLLNE